MAKKEKTETSGEGALVDAAQAIGTAAGKVAKLPEVRPEGFKPAPSQKVSKFLKKDKHRLPRKEKKALQKSSK